MSPTISRILQGISLPGMMGKAAPYMKTLITSDFFTADVAVKAGKWELVGEYVVPAQQEIRVGYGNPNQQMNQETVFIDIESNDATPVDIDGFIRIQIADANDVVKPGGVVLEERTEKLSENKTDRTKQIPLPEYMACKANKDDKIQIWMKADADATIGYDTGETEIMLPISVYRIPSV